MASLRDEITNTFRRLRRGGGAPSTIRKDNQPDPDETRVATDPREGKQYGTYRVLRRLGAGGMGHVYLAFDTRLARYAALKFLSPQLKADPEMLAMLQQEARTASSLNHPNILTIYDIDEADGEPFIASEYVEGMTLREALEGDRVPRSAALDIAIQIASALKPAHEAGIIHRDLKPGNVMLRPDGLVKVIDFGLAKLTPKGNVARRYEPLSDPGSIAGTVQYMSPEQARGDAVDHRTDLWSLGVMLYEIVAQRKPFDGDTESHIIVAILDKRVLDLKPSPDYPAGLSRVIEKALAKTADKRYQNADEMLSALKALTPLSQSRSHPFRLPVIRQPKRRWMWIAGAVLAAMIALGAWWWGFDGREMILGPDWFVPGQYTQITHRGDIGLTAMSPNGQQVAYTTENNGQDQLHLLDLVTGKTFDWQPYLGYTMGLTFSPDGSTVYYTAHDQAEWGRLYAATQNSPVPAFVLDDVDGPVAFSPDGHEFAFHRRVEERRTNHERVIIARKEDTGNQVVALDKTETSMGSRISWSPDGLLAVNMSKRTLDGDVPQSILIFTRDGKEIADYISPKFRSISGPVWLDHGRQLALTGFGAGQDAAHPLFIELATRRGEFRTFPTPNLTWTSMTASRDHQKIAAVTSTRKSTLWWADLNTSKSGTIDHLHPWASSDNIDSLAWTGTDSIAYSSSRGGSIHLWEQARDGAVRELPKHDDCVMSEPTPVRAKHLLVFTSNCDAPANASNLWTLDQTSGTLAKLTDHSRSDHNPSVSSDNDTVLYTSWPNNFPEVLKISLRTKVSSPFTSLQARNPQISPDGQHVACQIREHYDGVWRVALLSMRDGAIEKDNLPLPATQNAVVRWSPDGKALDYVDVHDSANIWRRPLTGAPAVALTHRSGAPISDFAWNPDGRRIAIVTSDVKQDVIVFHRRSL